MLIPSLVSAWAIIRRNRTKEKQENRGDAIGEMTDLVQQLKESHKQEKNELKTQINRLQTRQERMQEALESRNEEHAECRGHILYLEQVLVSNGLKFRPWDDVKRDQNHEES